MENNKKISKKLKFGKNPRIITKQKFELLESHLEELGDLSGVVFCHNHKAYVGGNQRSEIFDGAKIEITQKFDPPTDKKTIAIGFILFKGEKFAYREVVFTDEMFDKACIVANNSGGTNDWNSLFNEWNIDELKDWGVDIPITDLDEDAEPEDKLPKPDEDDMIAVTLNEEEKEVWNQAKDHIGIKNDKKAIFRLIQFMYDYENQG
ncbi:hypothetical protein [Elizabethkingia meningoseptica]|uniref:hypothetical protein n=1 Tax=Elizabethkingia meningoseptica TaxID=238 RepID=UPI0038920695